MDLPEIERLITNAIDSRPTVTSAPVNLYVHKGRVVCGARVVMPAGAVFVSHVTPDKLENGFDNSEWKLIVQKIHQALENTTAEGDGKGHNDFRDRRREQRLNLHRSIWFGLDKKQRLSQGQMVDIASGGIAFTCCADDTSSWVGQEIATRFSVPHFGSDDSVQMQKFTRDGRICNVTDVNSYLKRVAVQFAQPLPFRPAEQDSASISESDKSLTNRI